jgi:hypothetical protein
VRANERQRHPHFFSGITFPSPQANGLKNDHKSIVMASYCRRPPRCNVCYDIFRKDIRPLFVQYQYFSCYLCLCVCGSTPPSLPSAQRADSLGGLAVLLGRACAADLSQTTNCELRGEMRFRHDLHRAALHEQDCS